MNYINKTSLKNVFTFLSLPYYVVQNETNQECLLNGPNMTKRNNHTQNQPISYLSFVFWSVFFLLREQSESLPFKLFVFLACSKPISIIDHQMSTCLVTMETVPWGLGEMWPQGQDELSGLHCNAWLSVLTDCMTTDSMDARHTCIKTQRFSFFIRNSLRIFWLLGAHCLPVLFFIINYQFLFSMMFFQAKHDVLVQVKTL